MQNLKWHQTTLKLAAIYNLLWGSYTILTPYHFFQITGIEAPKYIEFWQCIGMIVGVYGVGYWLAARDPMKHYPIVVVGFLGKIFGPIGFAQALYLGKFPINFGYTIITNDLVWWIPFFLILKRRYNLYKSQKNKQ